MNELREIDTDRIDVRINSPGGDVFDGIAITSSLAAVSRAISATSSTLPSTGRPCRRVSSAWPKSLATTTWPNWSRP